jgi:hypothetical protein
MGARPLRGLPDEELGLALAGLGRTIELPHDPGPTFAVAVRLRIEREDRALVTAPSRRARWRQALGRAVTHSLDRVRWLPPARRAMVLAVVLVVLGAVAAGAAALGVRGVRIIFGPPPSAGPGIGASAGGGSAPATTLSPAPLGSNLFTGERVSLREARTAVSFPIVIAVPSQYGVSAPDVYLDSSIPGGLVTLVYPAGPHLPSIGDSGIGLVLEEFQGQISRPALGKFVEPPTTITDVSIAGTPGYWIAGAPHDIAYLGPDGEIRPNTLRLSGNALLWERGQVTLRMESMLTRARAVAIAASVATVG